MIKERHCYKNKYLPSDIGNFDDGWTVVRYGRRHRHTDQPSWDQGDEYRRRKDCASPVSFKRLAQSLTA